MPPEKNKTLIPFKKRKDLTADEKEACGKYQDVHKQHVQKNDWSFEIPENWKQKPYCFVINSCCRNENFSKRMTNEEIKYIQKIIQDIDSAIDKSAVSGPIMIYKGIHNTNWLPEDHGAGTEFTEKGFGSFSLNFDLACQYTNQKEPIIIQLALPKNRKALYMDQIEQEILLPRNIHCVISDIYEIENKNNLNKKMKVYYIEESEED